MRSYDTTMYNKHPWDVSRLVSNFRRSMKAVVEKNLLNLTLISKKNKRESAKRKEGKKRRIECHSLVEYFRPKKGSNPRKN